MGEEIRGWDLYGRIYIKLKPQVYNPKFNIVTFSEKIEDNDEEPEENADIYKTVSHNGKYILSYNKDIEVSEKETIKEIPLVINSIVSVGQSLYHLMKNGTVEKYG